MHLGGISLKVPGPLVISALSNFLQYHDTEILPCIEFN